MEPKLTSSKDELKKSTYQLQKEIDQVNRILKDKTINALLQDEFEADPVGYECSMQSLNITEIVTHQQITCFNNTQETCSEVLIGHKNTG